MKSILSYVKKLNSTEENFRLSTKFFLQLLGVIYLIAFMSLWSQVLGLLGSRGISPAALYLKNIAGQLGWERFWYFPSLFWFQSGDLSLQILCALGSLLSLFLILGFQSIFLLSGLWLIYLSFVTIGQSFFSFQWDNLLLEVGFLAVLLVSLQPFFKKSQSALSPPLIIVFLFRWLLFRLIFSSGIVKLASGDPLWKNLTALNVHYETQPLPHIFSWYVHQLPQIFQKFSVLSMFLLEIFVPFLIFGNRKIRTLAAGSLLFFQILIIITGNYCFFNMLTILLCIWLIDDRAWLKLLRIKIKPSFLESNSESSATNLWSKGVLLSITCLILIVSGIGMFRTLGIPMPLFVYKTYGFVQPLRTVNTYGLFAVMTTPRLEIVLEGSQDGKKWKTYEFNYKPGNITAAPKFVAPHQPRLDWQMWFAALSRSRNLPWFYSFCYKLLQGSGEVKALLKNNPFPRKPPKYIRALLYEYQFTDFKEKGKTKAWWKRKLLGHYCNIIGLKEVSP